MKPRSFDQGGLPYSFCPGKVSWFPWVETLHGHCKVAFLSGILPGGGPTLEDQDDLFAETFPVFVERYTARRYAAVWHDVRDYVGKVLEAVFKKH